MTELELFGTLGPACFDPDILRRMFSTGMTGLRINLSHTSLTEVAEPLAMARAVAKSCGVEPQILIDLQGPELRLGEENLPRTLKTGETVPMEALCLPKVLENVLHPGQELLLDDGRLRAKVLEDSRCLMLRGGELLPRKGVAAPGVFLDLPALTEHDHANLRIAAEMGVTGVLQSFIRDRADLVELRETMEAYGVPQLKLYAKIEHERGIETLPDWIDLADHIVIARGDLGTAVPLPKLPAAQKRIAAFCKKKQKPFMVVTQMLASMEHLAVPTRAEVCDIFNAVLDGAAALMLTSETATGEFPAEAMTTLCDTALEAQRFLEEQEEEN